MQNFASMRYHLPQPLDISVTVGPKHSIPKPLPKKEPIAPLGRPKPAPKPSVVPKPKKNPYTELNVRQVEKDIDKIKKQMTDEETKKEEDLKDQNKTESDILKETDRIRKKHEPKLRRLERRRDFFKDRSVQCCSISDYIRKIAEFLK